MKWLADRVGDEEEEIKSKAHTLACTDKNISHIFSKT